MVRIRNQGITLHNPRMAIQFAPKGGLGTLSIPLERRHERTGEHTEFARGMIAEFSIKTTEVNELGCKFFGMLEDCSPQNARLVISSQGYIAKSFRVGGRRDRLALRWNWIAFRFNRLFDRQVGEHGIRMANILPEAQQLSAQLMTFKGELQALLFENEPHRFGQGRDGSRENSAGTAPDAAHARAYGRRDEPLKPTPLPDGRLPVEVRLRAVPEPGRLMPVAVPLQGRVNAGEYEGRPPGTLLLMGVEYRSGDPAASLVLWELDTGWNRAKHSKTGRWEEVRCVDNDKPPYEAADFSTLDPLRLDGPQAKPPTERSPAERLEPEVADGLEPEDQVPGVVEQFAEAEVQVEAAGLVVDRVDLDGPDTQALGVVQDPPQGVDQEHLAQALPADGPVDGQAPEQDDGDGPAGGHVLGLRAGQEVVGDVVAGEGVVPQDRQAGGPGRDVGPREPALGVLGGPGTEPVRE